MDMGMGNLHRKNEMLSFINKFMQERSLKDKNTTPTFQSEIMESNGGTNRKKGS